jgi:hypothetical protein
MGWHSDLSGMLEVPDHWAEKMDDDRLLDVPPTKFEGEMSRQELSEFVDGLS